MTPTQARTLRRRRSKRHFLAGPEPVPLDRFAAAPDLRDAIGAFHEWLGSERRCSPITIASYGRSLAAFLDFQRNHLGLTLGLPEIERLTPADFRAWLASMGNRKPTSRALALGGVRSLFRFLARRGLAQNAAILLIRGPKLPKRLPKALTVDDASAILVAAAVEGDRAPWCAKRDVALVTLLWGCGLRISEALSLTRAEAPIAPGTLTVTGKGDKQRMVPVLPAVADAMREYLAACPLRIVPGGPLFVGWYGSPLIARSAQKIMARLRVQLGLAETATPHALRHYVSFLTMSGTLGFALVFPENSPSHWRHSLGSFSQPCIGPRAVNGAPSRSK